MPNQTPIERMNTRVIGKDILLYVIASEVAGGAAELVAGQREGGIDISRESVDLTTKNDWAPGTNEVGNGMRLFKPSFGTWKATLGGIITTGDNGADLLSTAVLAADQIMIKVKIGTKCYTGMCNINSFNRTGAMAGEATYTADLQGCGALTEATEDTSGNIVVNTTATVGTADTIANITVGTGFHYVPGTIAVTANGILLTYGSSPNGVYTVAGTDTIVFTVEADTLEVGNYLEISYSKVAG